MDNLEKIGRAIIVAVGIGIFVASPMLALICTIIFLYTDYQLRK